MSSELTNKLRELRERRDDLIDRCIAISEAHDAAQKDRSMSALALTYGDAIGALKEALDQATETNETDDGELHVDICRSTLESVFHDEIKAAMSSSLRPPAYVMSKDYEALYEYLKAGGEALGIIPHKLNDGRSGALIVRHGEWTITIGNAIFGGAVFPVSNDGKTSELEAFVAECQRLNLEWIAPIALANAEAGWIPVSERLPAVKEVHNGWSFSHDVLGTRLVREDGDDVWHTEKCYYRVDPQGRVLWAKLRPTHWQSIPDPPNN